MLQAKCTIRQAAVSLFLLLATHLIVPITCSLREFVEMPIDDAFTNEQYPTVRNGVSPPYARDVKILQVMRQRGRTRHSFLKFNLGRINGKVSEAKVMLKVFRDRDIPVLHHIHAVNDDSWDESTITWENKPPIGHVIDSQTVFHDQENYVLFDVTSYIDAKVKEGDSVVSFALTTDESSDGNWMIKYYSKEERGKEPLLDVTCILPPPIVEQTAFPTFEPTMSPSAKPTIDEIELFCSDSPAGWYDGDGEQYDCDWYGEDDNCRQYGDFFENKGTVAAKACCACGGGQRVAKLDPTPSLRPMLISTENPSHSPTQHPSISLTLRPTVTPTGSPTISPTVLPTQSPTRTPSRSPTFSPTSKPTPTPSAVPTLTPTKYPSGQPTTSPTLRPSPAPTSSPSSKPTRPRTELPTASKSLAPSPEPTRGTTQLPTAQSTLSRSLMPTPTASLVPTDPPSLSATEQIHESMLKRPHPPVSKAEAPTHTPTISIQEITPKTTGMTCSSNKECISRTCRSGVCMASVECHPIKHHYGTPFHTNAINVVFVGSAFNSSTHEAWREHVMKTTHFFGNYNMFGKDVDQLNVFYVDPPEMSGSFCDYGCAGIDRLLCCDIEITETLASKCFSIGANLQIVAIHNDARYGGAGYPSKNIATMSTHPAGALVAVHELGHSLFELNDEYTYGDGSGDDPNCSVTSSCEKWADLVGNTPAGYDKVRCIPGCQGSKYFISGKTYMQDLSGTVGAVNERFSCCTYLSLTKAFPKYCEVFNVSPNHLNDYCKTNDYQRYGTANYENDSALQIKSSSMPFDAIVDTTKYMYLQDPVLVKIRLRRNGKAVVRQDPVALPPGMYFRANVQGDFRRIGDAVKEGVETLVKVKVFYDAGKEMYFLSRNTTIDVPMLPPGEEAQDGTPRRVYKASKFVDLVLDKKDGRIKRFRGQIVNTKK